MPWLISGTTTTRSGTEKYSFSVAGSLEDVWRKVVFCHREMDTVDTIVSPEGVHMSEAEFLKLLLSQRKIGDT